MADEKPPKINEKKSDSEDRMPNPRSWMLWALGIFMVVMLFQIGRGAGQDAAQKVTYDQLQSWIASGVQVKGYIEYPPPNSSALCTITGYRMEDGKRVPFEFEDKLIEGREKFLIETAGFQPKNKSTLLTMFLIQLLPILLIFLLIWFVLIRQIRSAGRGAMSFGKSKARMLNKDKNKTTFKDVAGVEEACEEVSELVDYLKDPKKFQKLGGRIPKGILMVGPPGTGKTLLAKAIAGEADASFFSISGSDFVEMFVGVGASRVRDMFEQARKSTPCLVFIDEIDAVGRQRGAGIGGGNDEREQTLNQLLTEMDGFEENSGVILLAATNRADVLDAALLRPGRFDRRIDVGLPDRRGREAILAVHARTRPLDDAVSLSNWASRTPGFSGADLANLLNEAAILTARQNMLRIGEFQLEGALERITMGLSNRPLQDSAKKRLIAYHEVGHALVASLLPAANAVDKVTILPRGGAGGYTRFMPDEEVLDSGLITRSSCLADLVVALGGRAAEQVVFGSLEITQGASGDLQMVAQLAREMVTRFGFSNLGPMALEGPGTEVFLGRDWFNQRPGYAESTGQAIDSQIRQLAKNALAQAIALLEPRRELMDQLVDVLIAEETIDGDRFRDIAGLP